MTEHKEQGVCRSEVKKPYIKAFTSFFASSEALLKRSALIAQRSYNEVLTNV